MSRLRKPAGSGHMAEEDQSVRLDQIVSLARRRGFVFGSSEIYGGMSGFWDYGPLGVELKNNLKRAWWRSMVQLHENIVGLDSATILPEVVWQVSGHLDNFNDPLSECQSCKRRFRADDIDASAPCPECGGKLSEPRQFNTMFRTHVGPTEEGGTVAYLRPETAQGIFLNFKNVQQST